MKTEYPTLTDTNAIVKVVRYNLPCSDKCFHLVLELVYSICNASCFLPKKT